MVMNLRNDQRSASQVRVVKMGFFQKLMIWCFVTKFIAVKFMKTCMSNLFSEYRDDPSHWHLD